MKRFLINIFISIITLTAVLSCNERKPVEVVTAAEEIKSSDSSPVITRPDSATLDPETQETALQQDPPSSENSKPVVTVKKCDPNFTLIAKPKKTHQIFYASGFNAGEFKCWNQLEAHAKSICNGQPCIIDYVDSPDVKTTETPPNYLSDQTLMEHGIGRFQHDGKNWESKGARLWKRKGQQYSYYNSDN